MKLSELFETEECSRCGGSGRYSWCQAYGDTCFKCSGVGRTYTGRGQVAKDWYVSQLSKPVSQMQPGDRVWDDSIFMRGWHTVKSVEIDPEDGKVSWTYVDRDLGVAGYKPDELIRCGSWSQDYLEGKRAEALALQATLTKSGRPRATRAGGR